MNRFALCIRGIPFLLGLAVMTLLGCKRTGGGLTEDLQQDCVPASLARLSHTTDLPHPTGAADFIHLCRTDGRVGTLLPNIEIGWHRAYPHNPLVPILTHLKGGLKADSEHGIQFVKPYLWIGETSQGPHAALLYFRSNHVLLSHSQCLPQTQQDYEEQIPYEAVLTNTYVIYRIGHESEHIQLREVN